MARGSGRQKTPLYCAASFGYEAVVRVLIDSGADVNKADNEGRTPLRFAASNGHEAVARVLIDAGVDVGRSRARRVRARRPPP